MVEGGAIVNQIFLFVLWPVMLVMVAVSSRVKRPAVLWTFILFPPLCLVSLWWIPPARDTMHFVWVPAIVAMGLSLVSVLVRLCDMALLWRSRPRDANRRRLIRLLRPALIVLIVGTLGARERLASGAIRTRAEILAQQIQQTCEEQGACPETIEGWDVLEENPTFRASERTVRRLGREATLRYENIIAANQFLIKVNYNGMTRYDFHGGVGRDLRASANGDRID